MNLGKDSEDYSKSRIEIISALYPELQKFSAALRERIAFEIYLSFLTGAVTALKNEESKYEK